MLSKLFENRLFVLCVTYFYLARGLLGELLARLQVLSGLARAPCPHRVQITCGWLEQCLWNSGVYTHENYRPVRAVELSDSPGNRGLVALSRRVTVHYDDSAKTQKSEGSRLPNSLFLKLSNTGVHRRANVIFSGQAREGSFYALWAARRWQSGGDGEHATQLGLPLNAVPRVLYAHSSRLLGEFVMLLENLFDEQRPHAAERPRLGANMVFGNQLWGVPEPERLLLARAPAVDAVAALRAAFRAAASLHASHWCDPMICDRKQAARRFGMPDLRAAGWYRGAERLSWELGARRARLGWQVGVARARAGEWTCSPEIGALMDCSLRQGTWDRLRAHISDPRVPFALCHGDFHAANAVVELAELADTPEQAEKAATGRLANLILVDWSELGVWEPTADVAQMVISDLKVARFGEVRAAVREAYYGSLCELVRGGQERLLREWQFDFERCWRDFVRGGLDRWVWMFGVISGFPQVPAPALQYFHDQMHAFFVQFAKPLGMKPDDFALQSVALLL